MNKDKIWNIVLIISIILIIHGLTKTGSADKKEAQAGQGEVTLGAVGAGGYIFKKGIWGIGAATFAKILPWLIALFAFLPNIFSNWVGAIGNIFRPQPTIPMWVYIAGFVVLIMMVTGRRR